MLAVRGDVDFYTARRFREVLLQATNEGARQTIVDLSLVPFIDTAGLAVLVAGAKRLRAQNGSLVVVCPSAEVRRILKISGLVGLFGVRATRNEALAALGRQTA